MRATWTLSVLVILAAAISAAQSPAGTISGTLRDPSGAVIAGARVEALSRSTGQIRRAVASESGDYSFPALSAGEYQVSAEASGFQRVVRSVTVETGTTTSADLAMPVGSVSESVTAAAALPQMHYDSHAIGGVVTHGQIENIPLNGRSFLELGKLEPGVQPPSRANANRTLVPILGAPGVNVGGSRVTLDGGSVTSLSLGGSQMALSQDVVQEFQISTVNLDLSIGNAVSGGINVVTRSGGNELHGAAFYFFRDHKLAAYPALDRDPENPDPFFQRRQFGFALGGPIRRDRAFFFGNWERNEQRGVVDTNLAGPDFGHFSRVTPSPVFGNLISFRLDGRIGNAHTAFVRYSHDGSRTIGPITFASTQVGPVNGYPSTWARQAPWADQSLMGLTSVLRPTLVNDLRFSYFFLSSSSVPVGEQDCPGCLGIGAPGIAVKQDAFYIGRSSSGSSLGRRFHLNDSLSWQPGAHRARFGFDWEHSRTAPLNWGDEPATINLFSPSQVRTYNRQAPEGLRIPLPSTFNTLGDILQLPLQTFSAGVGDPRVPQENGSQVRTWNNLWLCFQDTWRFHPGLTMNYGLGWSVDRNLNYDLHKPALLAPILGVGGLGPTQKEWKNFSPMLGLAWAPAADGRTVIRAGAGLYYGPRGLFSLDAERAALGRPGLGRTSFPGSSILNPLPGISGVPLGTPLQFASPTLFTGANLMAILPAARADKARSLSAGDPNLQAIQITKQFSGGLVPADFPRASTLHAGVGVQRQFARDFVLSADFVYRHFVHMFREGALALDLNHYDSSRGPVIPKCISAQKDDPRILCSNGAIQVLDASGLSTYKGLLLRAEKRYSSGFQALASYTYSRNTATGSRNGFDLDTWLANRGPSDFDVTQIFNLAGVARLPWRLEMGLNFSYSSATPFSAYVGGIDFNGDGTKDDLLPGTTVNVFNRGMGRAELERLAAQFNTNYAGTKDKLGTLIPSVTLPTRFAFGDNLHALDVRLSRAVVFRERWRVSVIGEVFNLYNKANLSGYSGNLTSAAFGQPTSRATQVFGSGGPRAFQLAARFSF